ncbi:MAG: hypothetical protein U0446_11990 [Dehalococcoidia bacterium]
MVALEADVRARVAHLAEACNREVVEEWRRGWLREADRARGGVDPRPRQASRSMKTAPAAHDCGRQATGYCVGPWPSRRSKPQNSSGMRRSSMWRAASNWAWKMRIASERKP